MIVDLETQGKSLEAVWLAWGIIESNLNNVIIRIHALSSNDQKANQLLKMRVSDKLKLLRKKGYLPKYDYDRIQVFKKRRDGLAHLDGIYYPSYNETEKSQLVDDAIEATDATYGLFDRAFSERPILPSN